MPKRANFPSRMLWSIQSKAFFRSRKIIPFKRPLSIFIYHLLVICNNDVWVELFFLNSAWYSDRSLLDSRYTVNCFEINFSNWSRRYYRENWYRSIVTTLWFTPDLCIGDTHATLKSLGKTPISIDLLNITRVSETVFPEVQN